MANTAVYALIIISLRSNVKLSHIGTHENRQYIL